MYKNVLLCTFVSKGRTINKLKNSLCTININLDESNLTSISRRPLLQNRLAWYSANSANTVPESEIVYYEDVKKAGKIENAFVIDVREPEELRETGIIPGSINIPLGDVESTLKNMPDDEFSKKYGRKKPSKDTPLIFSCKLGKRSATAQEISKQLGFKNVKNYLGGWLDWDERRNKN